MVSCMKQGRISEHARLPARCGIKQQKIVACMPCGPSARGPIRQPKRPPQHLRCTCLSGGNQWPRALAPSRPLEPQTKARACLQCLVSRSDGGIADNSHPSASPAPPHTDRQSRPQTYEDARRALTSPCHPLCKRRKRRSLACRDAARHVAFAADGARKVRIQGAMEADRSAFASAEFCLQSQRNGPKFPGLGSWRFG